MSAPRLFAGPEPRAGAERLADHLRRLGPPPPARRDAIAAVEQSGLNGRGGGAFPAGAKWRSVAGRARGSAVVLANGAEGETLSWKDRLLMAARPHLVLDGAFLAAASVGADRVMLYVGERHAAGLAALAGALAERPDRERRMARIVAAPGRYVAGEESAAVHFVNAGRALPKTVPPRPFERGVDGRPTLVQNVETLAHAGLLGRFDSVPGTLLVSVSGAVGAPGVVEIAEGTTVGEAVASARGPLQQARAVLLGGYFGTWVEADAAWPMPLRCAVVSVLPMGACGVCETARIMRHLAEESAAQCGPCFFGLRALADACERIAGSRAQPDDLVRLHRWAGELPGRGACRHPDGAAGLLWSALRVFASEFATHRPHAAGRAA